MHLKIKKGKIIIIAIVLSLLWIVPCVPRCLAQEIQYPVPAYSEKELHKIREWEKQWAGKKIDKTNIDKAAEFLPESFITVFKNPDAWGATPEGFYFYISPYQQVMPTRGVIEATKKYAPLVKLKPDGTIANTEDLAGVPFPDPKTGLEIAYNVEFNTLGDNAHYRMYAVNINPNTKTERIADQELLQFSCIHRTEVTPAPAMTGNTKGFCRGMIMRMHKPAEHLNTMMAMIEYADPGREKEGFFYYSQFRRSRKINSQLSIDQIDGTDLIYDDAFPLAVNTKRFSYVYKGIRELLSTRHQDMGRVERQQGQALANCLNFERCKAQVVEVVSNEPQYPYSKRVLFIDPETHMILWSELYDKSGKALKLFIHHNNTVMSKKQLHFGKLGSFCSPLSRTLFPYFDLKEEKPLVTANEFISFPVGMTYLNLSHNHAGFVDQQSKYFEPEVGVTVNVLDAFPSVGNCDWAY
jgi:hypothetical protein